MHKFIRISDLVNPESGKTYRQENMEKVHRIPIGTLVEVLSEEAETNGLRLFVVAHERDFDGTPLYALSFDKTWTPDMYGKMMEAAARFRIDAGYTEEMLKLLSFDEPVKWTVSGFNGADFCDETFQTRLEATTKYDSIKHWSYAEISRNGVSIICNVW